MKEQLIQSIDYYEIKCNDCEDVGIRCLQLKLPLISHLRFIQFAWFDQLDYRTSPISSCVMRKTKEERKVL